MTGSSEDDPNIPLIVTLVLASAGFAILGAMLLKCYFTRKRARGQYETGSHGSQRNGSGRNPYLHPVNPISENDAKMLANHPVRSDSESLERASVHVYETIDDYANPDESTRKATDTLRPASYVQPMELVNSTRPDDVSYEVPHDVPDYRGYLQPSQVGPITELEATHHSSGETSMSSKGVSIEKQEEGLLPSAEECFVTDNVNLGASENDYSTLVANDPAYSNLNREPREYAQVSFKKHLSKV